MPADILLKEDGDQLLQEIGDALLVAPSLEVIRTPDPGTLALAGQATALAATLGLAVGAITVTGLAATLQVVSMAPPEVQFNNYLFVTVGDGMSTGDKVH